MDPTDGTDQTRETYWARMKEYFDKYNKSGIECTDISSVPLFSYINGMSKVGGGIGGG